MVCICRHLECKVVSLDPPPNDFSCLGVRLRGLNALVIALHPYDQKDHSFICRESLSKLHSVLLFAKSVGVPCIAAGDFPDA